MKAAGDRIRALLSRVPAPLALLVLIALVLGTAWSVVLAPLQPHDEAAHVAYVERLAESGTVPSPTSGLQPFGADQERAIGLFGLEALNQNVTARPDWSPTRFRSFEMFEETLDRADRGAGEGPNGIAKNPPLYYGVQSAAWHLAPLGFLDRLSVLRLVSVLLLCITVVLSWLLAAEIFNRTLPITTAAAFVALLPMAGYAGGIVNPDIASAAAWTAFLWLAVRMARVGPSVSRTALLSLVASAAILTHGRNLAILPALALSLAVIWGSNRTPLRLMLRQAFSAGAVLGVAALTLRILPSLTSSTGGAFGGETNLGNTTAFNLRQFISSIWQFYAPKLSSMEPRLGPEYGFRQFFIEQFLGGSFGSNEIVFSYTTYDFVQVAAVVFLVAFYTVIIARWPKVRSRWPAAAICGGAAVSLMLFLHLASYRSLIGGSNDPLITGRYLMPLVGVFGLVVATVVAGVPRRFAPVLAGATLGALFVSSIGGLGLSLMRFYA